MPIYAYRCEECGFAKDVLQKMSDPQLTECPSCAKSTFKKQLTAAGFQLKGSGWYATDFRGGAGAKTPPSDDKPAAAAAPEAACAAATPACADCSAAKQTAA
jgi:putative FmdB family regulatory protein